jgi:hypothetical protein
MFLKQPFGGDIFSPNQFLDLRYRRRIPKCRECIRAFRAILPGSFQSRKNSGAAGA